MPAGIRKICIELAGLLQEEGGQDGEGNLINHCGLFRGIRRDALTINKRRRGLEEMAT